MRRSLLFLTVAIILSLVGPVRADTLTFGFIDSPTVPVGTRPASGQRTSVNSSTFTFQASNSTNVNYKVDASGISGTGQTPNVNLALKNQGVGETGLGLTNDGDYEIHPGSYVIINIASLKAVFGITSLTFQIGSAQTNEPYYLYGSTKSYYDGTAVQISTAPGGTGPSSLSPNHDVYDVPVATSYVNLYSNFLITSGGASANNVLLDALTVTGTASGSSSAVPEPGSLLLLGTGLVGLFAAAGRRQLRAATKVIFRSHD